MSIDTRMLGAGWYQMEFDAENQWVWSTNHAFLEVSDFEYVDLHFNTNATDLTGKSQSLIVRDVNGVRFMAKLADGHHQIAIHCAEADQLKIEVDSFCPAEYVKNTDRRVLGIAVTHLEGNGTAAKGRTSKLLTQNLLSDVAPITIQVEVSTACHLSCVMCSRSDKSGGPSQHMQIAIWERLLEGVRGSKSVNFLGLGEPWTHPHFLEFLKSLDDSGVQQSITTTGDLIDDKRARFLGQLKHLRDLTFSIDSPDPDTYFKIRGTKLERTTAGLDRAVAEISDPETVRIHAVVMRDNIASMEGFPDFLERHSVKRLVIRGVIQLSAAARDMIPDYSEPEKEIIKSVARRSEALGVDVNLLPSLPDDLLQVNNLDHQQERNPTSFEYFKQHNYQTQSAPAKVCLDPWGSLIVTRDGDVFPCECYHLQSSIGSLQDNTFDEIWHGDNLKEFRAGLLRNENLGCRSCERRPWGAHPLNDFAAEEVSLRITPDGGHEIAMMNTGLAAWDKDSPLRLGTALDRDRKDSAAHNDSWVSENRVAQQIESIVLPGETATLRFRLPMSAAHAEPETFQFLVEGRCWLPGTQYELSTAGLQRRQGSSCGKALILEAAQ